MSRDSLRNIFFGRSTVHALQGRNALQPEAGRDVHGGQLVVEQLHRVGHRNALAPRRRSARLARGDLAPDGFAEPLRVRGHRQHPAPVADVNDRLVGVVAQTAWKGSKPREIWRSDHYTKGLV